MPESGYSSYKLRLLESIKAATPDKRGYVTIDEDGDENVEFLRLAMKELHEEGRFKEYNTYISPSRWVVRI